MILLRKRVFNLHYSLEFSFVTHFPLKYCSLLSLMFHFKAFYVFSNSKYSPFIDYLFLNTTVLNKIKVTLKEI